VISIPGEEPSYLLFDWLSELLYAFETDKLLLSEFDVQLSDDQLSATCRGEPMDASRHQMEHEVKAITYHHLRVEQKPDCWQAEVIVDI
jgi:SHS2 domain-containing protein